MAGLLEGLLGFPGTPPFNPNAPTTPGILNQELLNVALGRINPLSDIGAIVASLGGPIGANVSSTIQNQSARRQNAIQNVALLEQIQESRRRRGLLGQLGDLFSGTTQQPLDESAQAAAAAEGQVLPGQVPTANLPDTQQRMMGLLAQLSPGSAAQAMFGQERAEPAAVRTLEAAGIDPKSEIGRKLLIQSLGGGTEQQLQILDTMLKGIQIQNEQFKLQQGQETQTQTRQRLVRGLGRDIKDAQRLAVINSELRNTVGETGVPFSDLRRAAASGFGAVQDLMGSDSSRAKKVVSLIDEFNKISTRFAAQSATRLFDGGNITNFQLDTVSQSTPSVEISADANDRIIADTLETLLIGAEDAGVSVPSKREAEKLIRELRSGKKKTGVTPEQINNMPLEQVRTLNVESLSDAALEAMINRLKGNGG